MCQRLPALTKSPAPADGYVAATFDLLLLRFHFIRSAAFAPTKASPARRRRRRQKSVRFPAARAASGRRDDSRCRWSVPQRRTDHRPGYHVRRPPASGDHRYRQLSALATGLAKCTPQCGPARSKKPAILLFNFSRRQGKCGTAATSRF